MAQGLGPRSEFDDPFSKNTDFGTHHRISDLPGEPEMVSFTVARTPLLRRPSSNFDDSFSKNNDFGTHQRIFSDLAGSGVIHCSWEPPIASSQVRV